MSNEKITKIYMHQYDDVRKKIEIIEKTVIRQSGDYLQVNNDTVAIDSFGHPYKNPLYMDHNHLPVMYDSKPNPEKYIELLIERQAEVVKTSRKKYEEDNNFLNKLGVTLDDLEKTSGKTISRLCHCCGKVKGKLHTKVEDVPAQKTYYYIVCENCGAKTQFNSSRENAINEWNTGSCR